MVVRRHETGLTLLELMLAVFLASVMMSVIYGVVVSTVDAAERIEEVTAGTEAGPAIMNLIRSDLEAAICPDAERDWFAGRDRKSGTGDRDRIDFLATVPSFAAEDPQSEPRFHTLNEVGYTLMPSEAVPDENVLYRREDAWRDEDPLKGGRLTALYDRVTHFDVQYWEAPAEEGAEGRWLPEWSSKEKEGKLPGAVKVTLRLRVTDRLAAGGVGERTFALTVNRVK
jgi:type II secretory pathway component PulJ